MGRRVHIGEVLDEAAEEQRAAGHSLDAFARREDARLRTEHADLGVEYERPHDPEGHGRRRTAGDKRLLNLPKRIGKMLRRAGVSAIDPFLLKVLIGPMLAVVTEQARGVNQPREPRKVGAFRWPNELAVIKAGYHEASHGEISNAGRVGEHMRMGGTIRSTGMLYEPDGPDPYLEARDVVMQSMDRRDLELLRWAFVAMPDPPRATRAIKVRRGDCPRCYPKIGKTSVPHVPRCAGEMVVVTELLPIVSRGSAMAWAAAIREGRAQPPGEEESFGQQLPELTRSACTWWALVARQAGELGTDDDEGVVRRMRERVQRARRTLRDRLAAVDLGPGHRTRWLIPPPVRSVAKPSEDRVVSACTGIHIVGGLRQPCEVRPIEGVSVDDAAAWPRCDVCGWPRSPT